MLIQIIFKSNRFPTFTRMTAFLANCKLLSRKISRWCGAITLGTRLISGVMFFWWVCWWGRVKILIWWLSWDVAGWRLNLGDIVNNHWYVPVEVLPANGSGSTIEAVVFGCTVPVALLCPKIYSHWWWYHPWRHKMVFLRSPTAPCWVHGSSKMRNSVDNDLLPKIRFRQKSVTLSAVDISRKCWPKRRLYN